MGISREKPSDYHWCNKYFLVADAKGLHEKGVGLAYKDTEATSETLLDIL